VRVDYHIISTLPSVSIAVMPRLIEVFRYNCYFCGK